MSSNANNDNAGAAYMMPIAILLGAVLLSASIWMSAGSLTDALAKKSFVVNSNGGTPTGAAAPTPAAAPAPTPAPSPGAPAVIDVSGRPVEGGPNAKVHIIEFSDYQCPFCRSAEPTVSKILSDYKGQVDLVYMNFPLSFHENAQKAAEAAECANAQGKFWEYHDQLFKDTQALDVPSLKSAAANLGLDVAKFNTCLDGGQMAGLVAAQSNLGSQNGVGGTPTFFINGRALVGAQPYAQFKTAIDAALAS